MTDEEFFQEVLTRMFRMLEGKSSMEKIEFILIMMDGIQTVADDIKDNVRVHYYNAYLEFKYKVKEEGKNDKSK